MAAATNCGQIATAQANMKNSRIMTLIKVFPDKAFT
jgi:hypothetical protein